jgi:hypothetical protein
MQLAQTPDFFDQPRLDRIRLPLAGRVFGLEILEAEGMLKEGRPITSLVATE